MIDFREKLIQFGQFSQFNGRLKTCQVLFVERWQLELTTQIWAKIEAICQNGDEPDNG